MIFTAEDYQKIASYIKERAVKDTEFKNGTIPVQYDDYKGILLTGVQRGNNIKMTAYDFLNTIKELLTAQDTRLETNITSEHNSLLETKAYIQQLKSQLENSDAQILAALDNLSTYVHTRLTVIDDSMSSTDRTWSSSKIVTEMGKIKPSIDITYQEALDILNGN